MKLLTGLFRAARKRLQVKDTGADFRGELTALVENAESLSDDDINAKVDELKVSIDDLPDSDEKEQLSRYLEDFRTVKEQDPDTATEAVDMVAGLYEKLDTSANADAPAVDEGETVEKEKEVVKETTDEGEKVEKEKEVVKDGLSDEEKEELYQYIKRRFDEDAANVTAPATDEGETVEKVKEEEEVADGCTKDSGHRVAVALGNASSANVNNLFNMLKNRRA